MSSASRPYDKPKIVGGANPVQLVAGPRGYL